MSEPQGNGEVQKDVSSGETSRRVETLEDRIRKSDRWMIGLTALAVGAAIASAIIFGFQLSEMKSSAQDTKNLVKATNGLVTAYAAQEREIARLRAATENFAKAMRDEA